MKRVAINGMGRIGRLAFRGLLESAGIEVVAVNEKESLETVAYLLPHDGEHAPWSGRVSFQGKEEGELAMEDGRRVRAYRREDASSLPWGRWVSILFWSVRAPTHRGRRHRHTWMRAPSASWFLPLRATMFLQLCTASMRKQQAKTQ